MPAATEAATRVLTFLLVEGYSMAGVALAIEPLRCANRLTGREAWRWRLASLEPDGLAASNGVALPAEPAEEALVGTHALFVCGGLRAQPVDEARPLALLRKAARAGLAIGSISTGVWLLARAGLLDGYRSTISWEDRSAFQEAFPDLLCTDKLYEIDRDRLSCSGGTASLDLMLHLIAERHGGEFARQVANRLHHERGRPERDGLNGGRPERPANLPPPLRSAVRLMQRHVEEPLSVAEIAARSQVSPRQIERLFLRHLETSPARYYLALRIDRARELLLYSDRPILEVAMAAGFTSTSHFAHWFKRLQGVRPSELRRRAPSNGAARPIPPAAGGR